ncbi:MAG TPA: cupin domain-containing protein [Opitutaceae bacterium]|nr:cupin domain-containing protein [Opitutaceae bacterium]
MLTNKEQLFIEFAAIDWEDLGGGVRRKIMAYGDRLMAVYVEFKRGAVGARHRHPHHQITYVQSGAFATHIGGETRVLRGGDFYYIPTDVEHGVEALEDSTLVDFFTPMREDFVPRG